MRKETLLCILGILTCIAPLLGIPEVWRSWLLFIAGGLIILIAISYRIAARRRERSDDVLVHHEHDPREDPYIQS